MGIATSKSIIGDSLKLNRKIIWPIAMHSMGKLMEMRTRICHTETHHPDQITWNNVTSNRIAGAFFCSAYFTPKNHPSHGLRARLDWW